MSKSNTVLLMWLLLFVAAFPQTAFTEEEFTAEIARYPYRIPELTVVGAPTTFYVKNKDTMLDIARRNGLGYNEMNLVYPAMDPWVPPNKTSLIVPTFWVLPPSRFEQVVINLPELRLYFFDRSSGTVQTYPIGIGDEGWESPLGSFHFTEKRPNPSWYIPQSLQAKYGMAVMPPGPENPLGEYMMKFSAGPYGVHGTAMPWGVGRLVSHGCIRCYPEHIRLLYPQVNVGTKLEIIYEPIKFGMKDGQIYVEAHPDVYRRIPDYHAFAVQQLEQFPMAEKVDQRLYSVAINLQSGVPMNVTKASKPDFAQMIGAGDIAHN